MEQRDNNQCGENIKKKVLLLSFCGGIADSTVLATLLSRFIEF